MARFQLSLTADYVNNWGIWEAQRELIQNGLDAQQDGHAFTIKRGRDAAKTLSFASAGVKLERKIWLLGTSSKGGGGYRGCYGEGAKLSMLVFARLGVPVRIVNDDEVWTPTIAHSDEFGVPVLTIQTRKLSQPTGALTIEVPGVSDEDWKQAQSRFLEITPALKHHDAGVYGQVITDLTRASMIYVKGIYVQSHEKLGFAYNLLGVQTDRDRGMISAWDLLWNIAYVWREAIRQDNDLVPQVYDLLSKGLFDLEQFPRCCHSDVTELLAAEFRKRHGDNACPVPDTATALEVEHWGLKPVVCSQLLRESLENDPSLKPDVMREANKSAVVKVHALNSLGHLEVCVLRTACALLAPAAEKLQLPAPLDHVQIVEFNSPDVLGMYNNDGEQLVISLNRDVLANLPKTIEVLAHELAHCRGSDGDVRHQRTEGELFGHALAAHAKAVESQLLVGA